MPNLSNNIPPNKFPNIENNPNTEAIVAAAIVKDPLVFNVCRYGINCKAIPPTYNPTNKNEPANIQKCFILLTSEKV